MAEIRGHGLGLHGTNRHLIMSNDLRFDWWDTPNPTERGFVIEAGEPQPHSLADCQLPDFVKTVVTWADCPDWIKHAAGVPQALQGYRLIHAQKAGPMKRHFFFAKVRTDAERVVPIAPASWKLLPFRWDTVLKKLFAQEGSIPLSGVNVNGDLVTAENWQTKVRLKPGGIYPTWHRTRMYLSEKPWPRASKVKVPLPASIHWDLDGLVGGLPSVLHPGVVVENSNVSGAIKSGFGTVDTDHGSEFVQQNYPPTNMVDWVKHVIEDDRQKVVGHLMELRIVVDVLPPDERIRDVLSAL